MHTLGSGNQANIPAESDERATVPAGVVVDPSGNIYVAGVAATGLNGKSNSGAQDAYLVKYNPSGNLVWTRILGAAGNDGVTGIAINGTNISSPSRSFAAARAGSSIPARMVGQKNKPNAANLGHQIARGSHRHPDQFVRSLERSGSPQCVASARNDPRADPRIPRRERRLGQTNRARA